MFKNLKYIKIFTYNNYQVLSYFNINYNFSISYTKKNIYRLLLKTKFHLQIRLRYVQIWPKKRWWDSK